MGPAGGAPPADLSPARLHPVWPVICFGASFLVYISLIAHFLLYSSPPSGDQPFYLMDVASLVQDGDLNVKNNYDNHDEQKFYSLAPHPPGFVGMSAPDPLPRQLADSVARPPSEEYSAHPPGLAVYLAPAWYVGSLFGLWWPATIVAMCLIGALVGANVFLLAHEVTGRLWIALAVWAVVAFSNPVMTYSYLIFTELPTGLLLIYALRRLALGWGANGPGRRLLVGACIGYMPWLAERCVLIAFPLGLYATVQWWRYFRSKVPGPTRGPGLLGMIFDRGLWNRLSIGSAFWLLAPVLISVGLLFGYDLFRFGTMLPSATSHSRGQTEVFYWPWLGGENPYHFVTNSFGLLFDIQWGVLIYAPVLLLAAVGVVAMFRVGRSEAGVGDRRLLWAMLACSAPYLLIIMAYLGWNGVWCPPSRYQVTFVPLLAAPLAFSLYACRGVLYKLLYGVLALPGFASMAVMMYDPIRMWPFGDGRYFVGGVFDWLARAPESPAHVDLRHVLPSFFIPDEVRQPAGTAQVLGAAFLIVFAGSLLIRRPLRALTLPKARPGRFVTRALGWAGALCLLGLGWFVMNASYLQPQASIVEQHRWKLQPPLMEAHGMAYLDGNLYLASLGPRSSNGELQSGAGELGRFDPTTGAYTPLHLTSASGPVPYAYPGDIKVGPDGLLYLLNNGPGDQGLYVLKPDGKVMRRLALKGKGPPGIGLGIGPDGKLYTTDMGRIYQYGPDGGDPLASWGRQDGNFNNIAGVTVGPDNRIYGAEESEKRVHVFDSTGRFLTTYKLDCPPWQMVVEGIWLDMACGQGLRTLNRDSGEVRIGRIDDPLLGTLTGLAYGPANTLYVFDSDNSTIIAYKVQH
jgi:hypothetical protein